MTDATVEPSTEDCLQLAAKGRVSAYDAEFVFVAEAAGLPLVTGGSARSTACSDQAASTSGWR